MKISTGRFARACALAALVIAIDSAVAAEDEPASKFVKLFYRGTCDDKNNRLWLSNSHTFKTIVTTVRWKAAGGKDLKEQFYPAPATEVELGCAAESEIVDAQFAAF